MNLFFERLREWACEGGPVKTPLVASIGWFTWSSLKGFLEGAVLVGTATIVGIHVLNLVMRQWCPRRRRRNSKACLTCRFANTFFCPIRTHEYTEE